MGCGGSKPSGKKEASFSGGNHTKLPKILAGTQEVDLSENKGIDVSGISAVTTLEKIDLNSCELTALHPDIFNCAALEELLVFANKLKEIPADLSKLTALTTLNLFNNTVKKLPVQLGTMSTLEEVNCAGNKLMMLTDDHFKGLTSLKVLSLYGNNLVRMGSLAPCVALEELRISDNNLEEMPTLGQHSALTVFEIHKNRVAKIDETYFKAVPALQRFSIWGNQITMLPASLCACTGLLGIQAQENKLESLPAGPWPSSLETLFVQDNTKLACLPAALADIKSLKRVNLSKLPLDSESQATAERMKSTVLKTAEGIFWGQDGNKISA